MTSFSNKSSKTKKLSICGLRKFLVVLEKYFYFATSTERVASNTFMKQDNDFNSKSDFYTMNFSDHL